MSCLTRRELFGAAAAAAAGPARSAAAPNFFAECFHEISDGFLACAARTSPSGAVCDYAGGTRLPHALTRSGKSYATVTRMLPAVAAAVASGRDAGGKLRRWITGVYKSAFDPEHEDYWLPSPPDKADLRQVEASLVAWAIWLLRSWLPDEMGPRHRLHLQNWLASCTLHPVRTNNFAWFTAVVQAARIRLSAQWPEFRGDERWMLDDLAAMDSMHAGDGWYTDGVASPIHDYYSFWVFTSHYLYWREIVGASYPDWTARFDPRVRDLMARAPLLFGANGSHVLMGVSLIYRWAVLTALVLAYRNGLWAHEPGLLRAIARRNIEFFRSHGAFDVDRGKLRETLSPKGTSEFPESYIENGHPYWCMQAFVLLAIPDRDPFWSSPEVPLPVERRDFDVMLAGPKLHIVGRKSAGEVRLQFAHNGRFDPIYRDRYTKFSYSSHFPFCMTKHRERAIWDSALVFRNAETGRMAGRAGVTGGNLIDGGAEMRWWAVLDGVRYDVTSRVVVKGEREDRRHRIECPAQALSSPVEVLEGSYALPLHGGESARIRDHSGALAASGANGEVAVLHGLGYARRFVAEQFEKDLGRKSIHILAPRCAIATLSARLREPVTVLESAFLARPAG